MLHEFSEDFPDYGQGQVYTTSSQTRHKLPSVCRCRNPYDYPMKRKGMELLSQSLPL